jgi:hypothetical protein
MPHQGGHPGRQPRRQIGDRPVTGLHKSLPQQEILGGITAEDELRKDHQTGALAGRSDDGRPDVFQIPAKVSHEGIPLSQGDQHGGGSSGRWIS